MKDFHINAIKGLEMARSTGKSVQQLNIVSAELLMTIMEAT